jgi:hypothetical protein
MDHVSGNKSPMGSIEVPNDRSHLVAQHVKISRIVIHFWAALAGLQSEKKQNLGTKGSR